ncbi:MAG: hypothetical protein E7000_01860 [Coriobacteriaceae bacterium]|nr:hypothetical protein [Coriobacteriaceae bacterium]
MAKKEREKRRPASYFIDFENVRGAGLDGVADLAKGDRVTVLYGSKDSALKLEQVQNVMNSPAKVEFIKVATGKHDALDFQLVALMFMNMKKKRDYFIISKDTGFDFAIRMAKVRGMEHVYRRETISGATLEPKKLPSPRRSRSAKRLPQPKDAGQPQARETRGARRKGKPAPAETPEAAAPAPQQEQRTIEPAPAPQQEQPVATAAPAAQPDQQVAVTAPAVQPEQQAMPQGTAPTAQPAKSSRRRRRKPAAKANQAGTYSYRQEIEKALAQHMESVPPANQVDAIIAGIEKCETKARFYNYLRGTLGNEQGLSLYRDVKGCFEQLRAIPKTDATNAPE